jgi:putative mRNA 3-end processing factor
MPLLEFTDRGICCPQAGVYLDPWKPVPRALITHGHSDHARWGSESYLCTVAAAPVIRHRLQLTNNLQTIPFGETIHINGVQFSFHPAGHIPGSAQIRVAYQGEVWVFSGDYKLEKDNLAEPFDPIKCHAFITESTFGLPVYQWKRQEDVFQEINTWWRKNQSEGKVSVIAGYTLGKSQRILQNVDHSIGKIFVHGAVDSINQVLMNQGIALQQTFRVTADTTRKDYEGALVICPPSATGSPWMNRFAPYSVGIASGWMKLRGPRRRRGADRGFVLSDHADWNDLNTAIKATEAQRVFVTHGYTEIFAQWLSESGLDAKEVKTQYEGELGEIIESASEQEA